MTTADPNLGPLADNGGPTQTMALVAPSPALNTGSNAVCAAAIGAPNYGAGGLDQRGVQRPQGPACDLGAFELPADSTPRPPWSPSPARTLPPARRTPTC